MKNFNSIIRFLFLFSFVMFAVSCSDPYEEELNSVDLQTSMDAENNALNNSAKAKMYTVDFSELNGSGVTGMAELTLIGDQLTVKIEATGLEPDMLHPQHIHGFKENNRNSTCPPASADDDGDGLVELGEGLPFYGPVLLPLTPFPTAPDGIIEFEMTYTVDSSVTPLQNRAIVLHGMTVTIDDVETYIATLPVACGQIKSSQGKNK